MLINSRILDQDSNRYNEFKKAGKDNAIKLITGCSTVKLRKKPIRMFIGLILCLLYSIGLTQFKDIWGYRQGLLKVGV
jgi:hypothetical protein